MHSARNANSASSYVIPAENQSPAQRTGKKSVISIPASISLEVTRKEEQRDGVAGGGEKGLLGWGKEAVL